MKYIVFSLAFLICFLASSDDLYSTDCENVGCDSTFTNERVEIELPQFPGCDITILYEWRQCGDTIEIQVVGFREPDPTGPCLALLDSLDNSGVPNWDFLRRFLEDARVELVKQYFMEEYNAAAPFNKHLFECPNGKKYYNYQWRACTKWKYGLTSFEIDGITYEGWFFYTEECDDYACCEEQFEICFNTTTQQLEIYRALTNKVAGDCDNGIGTGSESGCSTPCQIFFID
jgi:hypothetical protein